MQPSARAARVVDVDGVWSSQIVLRLHDIELQAAIAQVRAELISRTETAEARAAASDAEAERLRDRSNKPEVFISSLESQLKEREAELKEASEKATRFGAKLKSCEDDWKKTYPKAVGMCTIEPPPAVDATFIETLEERCAARLPPCDARTR